MRTMIDVRREKQFERPPVAANNSLYSVDRHAKVFGRSIMRRIDNEIAFLEREVSQIINAAFGGVFAQDRCRLLT